MKRMLMAVCGAVALAAGAGTVSREAVAKEWRLTAREIEFRDQECPIAREKPVAFQPPEAECVERQALIWKTDRDPLDVALRRTRALAEDLKADTAKLDALAARATKTDVKDEDARYQLFTELVRLRKDIAFANPLVKDIDKLLFIGREALPPEEYNYGTCLMDQFYGFHAIQKYQSQGDGLYVLENPFTETPKLVNLLEGKTIKSKSERWDGQPFESPQEPFYWPAHPGGFLSPDVSWDGTEILFAWTPGWPHVRDWKEETCFHIMKCKADGSDLEMLTWGDTNDLFPCWLPNGRVVFCSERRGGFGRCHLRHGPNFTLHTMFPDGTDITCISPHETNEFEPSVDNDGMVVYTRWDYVDRGWKQAHHPWSVYPDGRDSREMFGNEHLSESRGPLFVESIRAIPGSRKYVATACGHHALIRGSFFIFDPALPDDRVMGPVKRLTPDQLFPESEWVDWSTRHSGAYGTAWPLSEKYFLCVYDGDANGQYGGTHKMDWRRRKYAVTLLDVWGNKVEIFRHDQISALDPMPLRARAKPPVIPHKTLIGRPLNPDGTKPEPIADLPKTAEVGVVNVLDSRYPFPEGVKIRELRIWQLLPKVEPMDGEPRLGAIDQHPGRRCLGTVPVEEDGSALFDMPVGVPFYMQALDEEGCAVQTMRSITYVQPGERLTCNGCHEPRQRHAEKPLSKMPLAFKRKASRIEVEVDGGRPFNYPNLVQPVLDRKCISCHAPANPGVKEGKMPDFTIGDIASAPYHMHTSFRDLVEFGLVQFYTKEYTGKDWWKMPVQLDDFLQPFSEPGKVGARASKLYQTLKKGHHGVALTREEMRRLVLFMDSQGSYISHDHDAMAQCRGAFVQPVLGPAGKPSKEMQQMAQRAEAEARTARFHDAKWGVFTHFLAYECKTPEEWNRKVEGLDVERLADQLAACGVKFQIFTLMQNTRYLPAPNATYDRLAGTQPGAACARRDLPAELSAALAKRGIDLYLYFSGMGPAQDGEVSARLGFKDANVPRPFVEKWSSVIGEYAARYGERVKGWWVDACYRGGLGYTDELMDLYARAIWAGNAKALVAMSDGQKPTFTKNYAHEDCVFGEFPDFTAVPGARFVDGAQTVVLAPLGAHEGGDGWTLGGCQHDGAYMADYVDKVNRAGGVVAIDAKVNPDGSLEADQMEVLKAIGRRVGTLTMK